MKLGTFRRLERKKEFGVYLMYFIFSFHYALLIYINSSFLLEFFSRRGVSILFALGSIVSILLYFASPFLEKRYGNKHLLFSFAVLEFMAVVTLSSAQSALAIGIAFLILTGSMGMVLYGLDILLESASSDKTTGRTRGLYLTLGNTALVLAPLTVSFILKDHDFSSVYTISALFLLLLFILMFSSLKRFKNPLPSTLSLPFKTLRRSPSVLRVTLVRLILEIFYSFMVIYMPLYLNQTLGFDWSTIGIMFTVMLLPFALFEWPLGIYADRFHRERQVMCWGILIIGASLLAIPFLKDAGIVAWMIILFMSRVGASAVEVMSESYFFKRVDSRDMGFISIFRLTRPLGFLIGPVLGLILGLLFPLVSFFPILAIIVLWGMRYSFKLRDTH